LKKTVKILEDNNYYGKLSKKESIGYLIKNKSKLKK